MRRMNKRSGYPNAIPHWHLQYGRYGQGGVNPPMRPPVKLEIVHAIMDESRLPERPEALIEGILRVGGKMVCSGKSKSGKSFLAIQLGVCVAVGGRWLGLLCQKGKVLYLNLEIDEAQFMKRVYDVAHAMGVDPELVEENFLIAKRPRSGLTMAQFVDAVVQEGEAAGCSLVIIDPQYKVFEGNENEQHDMAAFYAQVDRLVSGLGCAVLVVHHQSKGYKGNQEVEERASGSGVFGRDPDAIMSIDRLAHPGKAMRAQFVLRDYPDARPIDYWFDYPLCERDVEGELADCKVASGWAASSAGGGPDRKLTMIEAAYAELAANGVRVKCADIAKVVGVKSETVRKKLEKTNRYKMEIVGRIWYASELEG